MISCIFYAKVSNPNEDGILYIYGLVSIIFVINREMMNSTIVLKTGLDGPTGSAENRPSIQSVMAKNRK